MPVVISAQCALNDTLLGSLALGSLKRNSLNKSHYMLLYTWAQPVDIVYASEFMVFALI